MRVQILALALATSCAASSPPPAAPQGLQIKLTTIYVDDQDKALHFYTDVLGFAKKDDVRNGGFRWLTVSSPSDPDGTQLQLAANDGPAAKAYQQAQFQQHQPAVMLFTRDLETEVARIQAKGAALAMPPTDVTHSTIAQVDDTCGNLVQLTQLH
jgi:predicted enzyme related to lactoylglutathione lyase